MQIVRVEREVTITARRGDGSEFSFVTARPDRFIAPEPFDRLAWLIDREQVYLALLGKDDLSNGARARLDQSLEWIRGELAPR